MWKERIRHQHRITPGRHPNVIKFVGRYTHGHTEINKDRGMGYLGSTYAWAAGCWACHWDDG